MVYTVRGDVPVAELGATLSHEHVVVSSPEFARDYPELAWPRGREAEIDRVAQLLQQVRARGIRTIIDCTAVMHGRDMDFLATVNSTVDLNIIASTGVYTFDYLPHYLQLRAPAAGEQDILTRMFLRDITSGIGDSGIRAQNIKVATDTAGITANNERILRAAARASIETGVPITTHTHAADRVGLAQQAVFAEEGLDLRQVVIGHSGDSTDLDYLQAMLDAGSAIASDRFGLNGAGRADETQRVATLAELCRRGYAEQLTLSHDSLMCCDWMDSFAAYPAEWTPTHLSDVVLPKLRAAGVSDADLDAMLITAPARMFAALGSG